MDRTEDPMIRLEGLSKRYPDGTVAVHELDLVVARGELTVLVGPSGCGKTTTMKMINRLVEPSSGKIFIDGEDVTGVDPVQLRRRVGYVIQQIGLFPHQTIRANVATVPSLLGWDRAKIRNRVDDLLELVGLEPGTYGDRYPHQLSGGQRQRVGVARALAADPPVLLMDEPFGAVDPIARDRLQLEFLRLQQEVRKTIVFVTHDIEEAVRLGDRIAVFRTGGYLEQYDQPATVLGNPASEFVAGFVGADRGLKQLSVTPLEDSDIEHPPTVLLHDTLAMAYQELKQTGARWAVVLDESGRLRGWIGVDSTHGRGTVADRVQRMEAWVRRTQSLKDALAEMLQNDAGWVAVLDGDRYLGVVTPNTLHEGLRRAIRADISGQAPEDVELTSVTRA